MTQPIFKVSFRWKRVQKLIAHSSAKLMLVHDDGTYLLSDNPTINPRTGHCMLARPVKGGLPAGQGDDFSEDFPLEMFKLPEGFPAHSVTFRVYPQTITMTINQRKTRTGEARPQPTTANSNPPEQVDDGRSDAALSDNGDSQA